MTRWPQPDVALDVVLARGLVDVVEDRGAVGERLLARPTA